MKSAQFNKLFLFCAALVPALVLPFDYFTGNAGRDPANYLIQNTGILALFFLVLSLAVTPLRWVTGKNHWSVYRRQLGLFSFFYALLHLLCFIFIFKGGNLAAVIAETFKRPFIYLGMSAFLLMVPLAVTSTAGAIKRLGNKRWKLLHKLVYVSAVAATVHYLMSTKLGLDLATMNFSGLTWLQWVYFGLVLFLLGFRVVRYLLDRAKVSKSAITNGR